MRQHTYCKLAQVRNFMRHSFADPISLTDMAAKANLSRYHFLRSYKQTFQETHLLFYNLVSLVLVVARVRKSLTIVSKFNRLSDFSQ